MPITQMALSGSVYTTVTLTVERYISVVVPFFRQRHNLKAWIFIAPVAVFVVAYNIPRFFEIVSVDNCNEYASNSTAWRHDSNDSTACSVVTYAS